MAGGHFRLEDEQLKFNVSHMKIIFPAGATKQPLTEDFNHKLKTRYTCTVNEHNKTQRGSVAFILIKMLRCRSKKYTTRFVVLAHNKRYDTEKLSLEHSHINAFYSQTQKSKTTCSGQ